MTETKAQQECPYCHEPYKSILREPGINVYLNPDSDGYLWLVVDISRWGFSSTAQYYCPMCGRNLAVDK